MWRDVLTGSIALVILAAIDAAFSGDWSRIGAITKDQEAWLQSAVKALGVWHALNGAAAFVIADQNGKPKVPITLKVRPRLMLIGASVHFSKMDTGQ